MEGTAYLIVDGWQFKDQNERMLRLVVYGGFLFSGLPAAYVYQHLCFNMHAYCTFFCTISCYIYVDELSHDREAHKVTCVIWEICVLSGKTILAFQHVLAHIFF